SCSGSGVLMADSTIPQTADTRTPSTRFSRRLPIGAEPVGGGRTHFRVWAPAAVRVAVALVGGATTELNAEHNGYFSGIADAAVGARYHYKVGDDDRGYPDPASRFQPEGPHGPSEVVDPGLFKWRDGEWPGITLKGQVLYELHTGTFTPAGTWHAAAERLKNLKSVGITTIELMPVAEFSG